MLKMSTSSPEEFVCMKRVLQTCPNEHCQLHQSLVAAANELALMTLHGAV